MAKKRYRQLAPDRQKAVLSEIVDMYIENDGVMPSSRQIKKNRYISEEEVAVLRNGGILQEWRVKKLAEEKTGKTFLSSNERRVQNAREEAKKRAEEKERKLKEDVRRMAEQLADADKPEDKKVEEPKKTEAPKKVEKPKEHAHKEVVMEDTRKNEQVEAVEQPKKPEEVTKKRKKTKEEYTEELRALCRELRCVPTQSQIKDAAAEGKCAQWVTLQKRVAPWYMWSEMFSVPFKDDKLAQVAGEMKQKHLVEEAERAEAQERFDQKVKAGEVQPTVLKHEKKSEELERFMAGKEAALAQEPSVDEKPTDGSTGIKALPEEEAAQAFDPEENGETKESTEENSFDETVELPFKLVVPKGIHGTFSIHFSI